MTPETAQFVLQLVAGAILTLIGWLAAKVINQIEKKIDSLTKELEDHQKDCNEVPKAVVLTRLDSLYRSQDAQYNELIRRLDRIDQDRHELKIDLTKYIDAVNQSHRDFRQLISDKFLLPPE